MKTFVPKVLFELGDWKLQRDTVNGEDIASIRHECPHRQHFNILWYNGKYGITSCYCGEEVPEEIQALCLLYNMEWLQRRQDG